MRNRFVPLLAVMALAACLEDTAGPIAGGSFEATLAGQYEDELSGTAHFGWNPGEGFAITLSPFDVNHLLAIGHPDNGRPAVGAYDLESLEEEGFFGFYARNTVDGVVTFVSYDGILEITTSTSDLVEGWITFLARAELPWQPGELAEISVDATFSAVCGGGVRCD
jgi:hypothetical protein